MYSPFLLKIVYKILNLYYTVLTKTMNILNPLLMFSHKDSIKRVSKYKEKEKKTIYNKAYFSFILDSIFFYVFRFHLWNFVINVDRVIDKNDSSLYKIEWLDGASCIVRGTTYDLNVSEDRDELASGSSSSSSTILFVGIEDPVINLSIIIKNNIQSFNKCNNITLMETVHMALCEKYISFEEYKTLINVIQEQSGILCISCKCDLIEHSVLKETDFITV
jgi:hypothetical protein